MAPQGPVRHRMPRRRPKAVPVLVVAAAVAALAAVVPVASAATTPAGRSVAAGDLAAGRPVISDPPQPSCFPYPRHDQAEGPHTQVRIESGVQADPQLVAALKDLWEKRWPGAWQVFANPADLAAGDGRGVSTFVIGNENRHDGGVYEVPYQELVDSFTRQSVQNPDLRGDLGMWMHEGAHFTQGYGYDDAPRLFVEGIADMIRFVAWGEDPAWKILNAEDVGSNAFDKDEIWSVGYRPAGRFLLWVTQHYDRSGDRYALVHDINAAVHGGERDFEKLIRTTVGKSFDELLAEYRADPRVNPHC